MKSVLRAALAAALVVCVAGSAAPALAQKKGTAAADEPPPSNYTPEFKKAYAPVDSAMKKKDYAAAAPLVAAARPFARNNDEMQLLEKDALTIAVSKNDSAAIRASLDSLIDNRVTPSAQLRQYRFSRGKMNYDAKRHVEAIADLVKARELGAATGTDNLAYLLAQSYFSTNRSKEGQAEMVNAIAIEKAAGRKAPETWYITAAGYLQKTGDMKAFADWRARLAADYPNSANLAKMDTAIEVSKKAEEQIQKASSQKKK